MDNHEIYLAGGCFWGTQAYIVQLPGVMETEVGYANGTVENPTYEAVCFGSTGAAECVHVIYDAQVLPLELLLLAYFRTIDPTAENCQGNDRGTQYRTGIYWVDRADGATARCMLARLQQVHSEPLAVEAIALRSFYPAEEYHQDYLAKNPGGYCHVDLTDAQRFIQKHRDHFGSPQPSDPKPVAGSERQSQSQTEDSAPRSFFARLFSSL